MKKKSILKLIVIINTAIMISLSKAAGRDEEKRQERRKIKKIKEQF